MAGTRSTTFKTARTGFHGAVPLYQSIWTMPIINASPLNGNQFIICQAKESNTDESVLKKLSQHKLDNAFSRLDWGGGVGLQVGYLWCYSSGLHACIQARDSQALFKLVHGFSDRYTEDQVGFNGSTPLQELLSDSNVAVPKS